MKSDFFGIENEILLIYFFNIFLMGQILIL